MKTYNHHVIITGVSSGIGLAIASAFLEKGSRVFGTVRKPGDGTELARSWGEAFCPLIADVRDESSVTAASALVKKLLAGKPLDLIVNNAGTARPGPLAEQPLQEIRDMFEVNVTGLLTVTQQFLPLLNKGSQNLSPKIINISSVAGKICAPFLGGYAASKHAVEALSASLRRELMPLGIDVIVVGPGNVITPIWEKATQVEYSSSLYSKPFRNFLELALRESRKGMKPEEIARLVVEIAFNPKPKTRYAPVAQKFPNWILPRILPDRVLDKMMFSLLKMEKR